MLKRILLGIAILFATAKVLGQQTLCLGTDTTVCVGQNVIIENCGGNQVPGGTVLQNPNSVNLTDDSWSGVVNIGFSFDFYGNTYTQCVIGSNCLVSFDLSNANTHNTWSFSSVNSFPSTGFNDAKNAAMLAYSDINPGSAGNIYYQTIGTAPNREFYVVYSNIPMFSASDCNYMTLILFEGSNNIEYHIGNKTINTGWNGGLAAQGVQNAAGTVATMTPGRNLTQWTATNDGQLFEPTSPTNTSAYTNTSIPFKVIFSNTATFEWESTNGQTYPYNNGILNINNVQAGITGYYLTLTGTNCNSQVGAVSDTSFVEGVSSSVSATAVDDICSAGIGSVTATPTGGAAPYTYNWPGLGNATTPTVNNVSAGTYTVEMTDDNGCMSTATVTVGDTPASYPTDSTQVTCPGGSDGTATAEMNPVLGNVTYQWNDPNNQITSTAVGLTAGIYECTITSDVGCVNTVTVEVTEIPAMQIQVVNKEDVTCNDGEDGIAKINVTDGTSPYSYNWTGSVSTQNEATDLAFGTTTVTVTDDNGCVVTEDINIDQPDALEINKMSQDTIICIDDSVRLFAVGTGGSSPYTYTWESGGQTVATGSEVYVTPTTGSTEYCLTLSEQCGSPVAEQCVTVNYPAEVDPTLSTDTTGGCYPVTIAFDNITNTSETVNYTIWSYGDGDRDTIPGENSTDHEYGEGIFDVELEVVTNRGCRYIKNYPNLIEGYPFPQASFYVNPNPASVFEPKVTAYSQSGSGIISYEWIATGADPEYSSLQNPSFEYPNEIENYPLILVVENEYECRDTLQRLVRIENEVLLFTPNTFTPDGDGLNDTWKVSIQGIDIKNFQLEIFNRWGEKVFESLDPDGAWDGTYGSGGEIVKEGTYVWIIKAYDYENDNKHEFNGTVTILK